jgi:Sensors of blue-light using FAD
MLVRLMYASRAADSVNQNELVAILKKSKANNAETGVTGVLCFSAGIFLQVLEGGRSPVSALYNKIANDPRHHDVVLLSYEEVDERRFAGWSMGRANLSRLNPALVMKYSESALLNPYAVSGKMSMALFNELVASAAIICET